MAKWNVGEDSCIPVSGVGRCQKVWGGGRGTHTRNLCTFDKEPI